MGRMTIKRPKKKIKATYDAEFNDMREWQDNMYNPGHYIGTGKVPYPLKVIAKNPKLKIVYLLYFLIPIVISLFFMDLEWYNIVPIVSVIGAVLLIVWDSKRTVKKLRK